MFADPISGASAIGWIAEPETWIGPIVRSSP
jgi:hypothetical protein